MTRDRYPRQSLGTFHAQIKESRVLMVGAGGIGCELLKNLVLTGFGEIHIVDLDTIDLSNLNRQFLFRHEHVKRPKALVAKESAARFNPNVKIEAHHANIKDPQFNLDWFASFNLVFNALDNLEARRHVNKMCLAADVPLVESGTTGFNGQVQVIKKGRTECYDCNPKETPKTFPVCTIRSTPSQPIHCIVWAKSYLFAEVFGTSEDDAPELDMTQHSDDAKEIEQLRSEARALKHIRESIGSEEFPRLIFQKVFNDDIERLRSMEDMWRMRKKPNSLDFDTLSKEAEGVGAETALKDQNVWTTAENFAVFIFSLRRLSDRLEQLRANADVGNAAAVLSFDKDDRDTLDFVAASANLRSIIFDIPPKSEFDIKQMAGNIIPAIATTNAMTAGLCVLQAFKVLREDYTKARNLFLTPGYEDRIISSEALLPPKPDCPVCGVCQARLDVDTSRATLNDLVQDTLRDQLGYGEEITVTNDTGIVYDPDLEDNLPKKLTELDIKDGSFITVADDADDEPRVNLVLAIGHVSAEEDAKPIVLASKFDIARKVITTAKEPATNGHVEAVEVIVTNGDSAAPTGGKRKREADGDEIEAEVAHKRGKVAEEISVAEPVVNGHGKQNGFVVLDDQGDGSIVIDD